jgi:L-alanine-DL-glutamate epimerase-like enolase superfamily enzyme
MIRTDEGAEGVAYSLYPGSSVMLADMVDRILRDALVGEDPMRREWIWHKMWELDRIEEFPVYLLGIVDVALWDMAGRAAGMPVWQLLGGFRDEIPAYASTTTFSSDEEFLDVADQCLELGYSAIKLHAYGNVRDDARLCTALRAHVGDDVPLMYDGSAGFDLVDAVYLGHVLQDAGFFWYEEPIREFSITSYKWLSERVKVPLHVAETSDGAHMNTADFIASGCASFVRASVDLRGGFTGAMRTAHLADSFRLRAEPHGNTITSRHLCMAIPNATYYESLIRANPVTREWGIDSQGMVGAPTWPGVGLPQGPEYPKELERFVVDQHV